MPSGLESALVLLCWAYVVGLAGWLALRILLGDRPKLLFFINSLAHLFFLPAPFVFLLALASGNLAIILGSALAAIGFAYLWLLPILRQPSRRRPETAAAQLRVATFNLLWVNQDVESVAAAIRALDADLIAVQELTPEHAAAIEGALEEHYPHRLLRPLDKAYGLGLLSRLPLSASHERIPDPDWLGEPLIAELTFAGSSVTVVACHAAAIRDPALARERQARALTSFALNLDAPCVVTGDFNTTPLSVAYGLLRRGLTDVWLNAGRGYGHTFPGKAWARARGDGLPRPLRRFVPRWLLRIDYILVTEHWRPVSAVTAVDPGGSDHRPVVADLALRR